MPAWSGTTGAAPVSAPVRIFDEGGAGGPSSRPAAASLPSAGGAAGGGGGGASAAAGYNRGYRERDMTGWCATRLRGLALGPVAFKLPGVRGTLRTFQVRTHPDIGVWRSYHSAAMTGRVSVFLFREYFSLSFLLLMCFSLCVFFLFLLIPSMMVASRFEICAGRHSWLEHAAGKCSIIFKANLSHLSH